MGLSSPEEEELGPPKSHGSPIENKAERAGGGCKDNTWI